MAPGDPQMPLGQMCIAYPCFPCHQTCIHCVLVICTLAVLFVAGLWHTICKGVFSNTSLLLWHFGQHQAHMHGFAGCCKVWRAACHPEQSVWSSACCPAAVWTSDGGSSCSSSVYGGCAPGFSSCSGQLLLAMHHMSAACSCMNTASCGQMAQRMRSSAQLMCAQQLPVVVPS